VPDAPDSTPVVRARRATPPGTESRPSPELAGGGGRGPSILLEQLNEAGSRAQTVRSPRAARRRPAQCGRPSTRLPDPGHLFRVRPQDATHEQLDRLRSGNRTEVEGRKKVGSSRDWHLWLRTVRIPRRFATCERNDGAIISGASGEARRLLIGLREGRVARQRDQAGDSGAYAPQPPPSLSRTSHSASRTLLPLAHARLLFRAEIFNVDVGAQSRIVGGRGPTERS
jgi:hypothetical protein